MLSMAAGGQCLVAALTLETELVPVLAQGAHLLSCREEEEVKASCLFLLFLQSRRFQVPHPCILHPLADIKLHSHPAHGDSEIRLLFRDSLSHPGALCPCSSRKSGLRLCTWFNPSVSCSLHLFIIPCSSKPHPHGASPHTSPPPHRARQSPRGQEKSP